MNKPASYNALVKDIGALLQHAREKAAYSVNTILVNTYWHIGRHIVEYEQRGKEKQIMELNS